MRIAVLLFVALGSGCASCAYPFSVDADGELELQLGVVSNCTADDDGTVPTNGQPDDEGNLTRFTHRLEGTTCRLHAEWSGPLVDTAKLREDAEEEMRASGIDPDNVEVRITSIAPTVTTVGLTGKRGATLVEGISYQGEVSIDGDEQIIVIELPPGGDTAEPDVTVNESPRLLELANEAWLEQGPLLATGTADVAVDLTKIGGTFESLPSKPKLRIEFVVTLEGHAFFD